MQAYVCRSTSVVARYDKTMLDGNDYEFRSMHDAAAKASRAEEQVDLLHNACVVLIEVVRAGGQVPPPLARRAAAMDEVRLNIRPQTAQIVIDKAA